MQIHILGAGLVGSLLGIYLAKKNYQVTIYEKRSDFRKIGFETGRSINLALSHRGFNGLAGVGLAEKVRTIGIAMTHRAIHALDGTISTQPYGTNEQAIYAVSRSKLNEFLLDEVEKFPQVTIHFDQQCNHVHLQQKIIELQHTKTGEKTTIETPRLIGADGAFSALRTAMTKTDRVNYSQTYLEHGYKELTILPKNNVHQLTPNALHIWPRTSFMLIALPNLDGSFTCTLFLAFEGAISFENLKTEQQIEDFFHTYFPDVIPLLPTFVEDFMANPTSSLVTVHTKPWIYGDTMALIGDAAHAIVPFYGQGMNAGFEDCFVLAKLLTQENGNWKTALQAYQQERIPNTDAIAELALMNFVEMRDLVGNPRFLVRKKIEAKLHELYPTIWLPLYTMVTFSAEIPYKEALRIGKIQDVLLKKIMQQPAIEHTWQDLNFDTIIAAYHTELIRV